MSQSSPVTGRVAEDWSCAADFLDDIEVNAKGMCRWTDVANAQTHIRAALHSVQPRGLAQKLKEKALRSALERALKQGEDRQCFTYDLLQEIDAALADTSTDCEGK